MASKHSYQPEDLRKYFDANTTTFLRFGEGAHAIRRAVWAPGVDSKAEAFRHVDRQILAQLPEGSGKGRRPRLLDLGCGVGASLAWMAREAGADGLGVTISPVQARMAQRTIAAAKLSDTVRCIEASFTALPDDLGTFDLAFSIEAFVLSPDPAAYLREAARHVRPGGRLVIVDDFLTPRGAAPQSRREQRWIDEFKGGWLASSLLTVSALVALADAAGFARVDERDYTSQLELRRPRDLAITALVALGRHLPIPGQLWRSWIGGNGLQMALTRGLIDYRLIAFERRS